MGKQPSKHVPPMTPYQAEADLELEKHKPLKAAYDEAQKAKAAAKKKPPEQAAEAAEQAAEAEAEATAEEPDTSRPAAALEKN